jgi:hypothetical protein
LRLNLVIAALVVLGIIGHISAYRERPATAICGTDFPIFYAGAKLLGTPELYSPVALQRIQRQEIGCVSGAAAFIRFPYFAALVWPLSRLPLGAAFAIWRLALVAAAGCFIASYCKHWKWALLACVWSFPLTWDIDNGQDVSFLLAAIAAGTLSMERGRRFLAGLCFSLCAAKIHLILLVPMVLAARKEWRALAGMAAGGAALAAVSFAVGGLHWPVEYLTAIGNRNIDPVPLELHNIRGMVHGWMPAEIALSLTVAAAVWLISRRAPFETALAAALAGGLLASHHLTASDWAMLLPVCLTLAIRAPEGWVRNWALLLITPLTVALNNIPALARIPDYALLGLVYALVYAASTIRTPTKVILTTAAGGRIL